MPIPATEKIWMDGVFVNWGDAKIHVMSHSLHYGSGVFEGIRFYEVNGQPCVFRLKEHVERLFYSASVMGFGIKYGREEVEKAILETIKVNKVKSGYIRPLIFYGYGSMSLEPKGAEQHLIIAVWPWGAYLGDSAVKVKVSKYVRLHPKSSEMGAKISGHYFNSTLAHEEASKSGYKEALLLDYKGNIAEGPGENFFIVKDGKIKTPRLGTILPGITRDSIIKIAKGLGYDIVESDLNLQEVYEADEAFFTGTAAEVTLIESVDDKPMKSFEMSKRIKQAFLEVVKGKNDKYKDWLTKVN